MADVELKIECAGMINGEIITANGLGRGSVERGVLGMELSFSSIPPGFSVYCASLWTVCCSTPTFAIEQDGAVNMLTLAKGRYRCARTFDFGRYGTYEYSYEIRLNGDKMRATGVLKGNLKLPEILAVNSNFTEMMVPVGGREIRSFATTAFFGKAGTEIPVTVTGLYSPLPEDEATADWSCCSKNQVRRSFIDVLRAEGSTLALEYRTVVKGIDNPSFPGGMVSGASS